MTKRRSFLASILALVGIRPKQSLAEPAKVLLPIQIWGRWPLGTLPATPEDLLFHNMGFEGGPDGYFLAYLNGKVTWCKDASPYRG